MTEGLRNLATRYNFAINDPDLIRRYRMYEDGKHDVATKIEVAKKNTRIEDTKGFKQHSVEPTIISCVTGLSLDEIARL